MNQELPSQLENHHLFRGSPDDEAIASNEKALGLGSDSMLYEIRKTQTTIIHQPKPETNVNNHA